ncbi:metallophosphoesterase [Dinoroseobacter shibae DFL 12 = DSM 16493]|jgi:serine/threonine protein phosphatase 1|uniref:Metallophosphoesterase n=1 Tax=Dinoroseobacter shibae (strain DSM 16493 / NCIMB 14021 / DFL 12) TaxID=398580 RepID=A8LNF8_DINSH|nr:metallophosphoesterase [Dinoroseobacter shibae]ABV95052.1 metallophosphoesterase [Dinoroseobacter shibae DFL 12 = DSM 16493]URF46467.1 metallophosphoesterase [Dinoroseobacter shibae]URF50773.1 metallophosphoesterase [Dinoroseobacter shibae]
MRLYILGDIHGQLDQLRRAHRLIAEDKARVADPEAPVVHLGDLVDRGPDSRGVLDHLIAGRAAGAPWIVLKGNHDRMFARFARNGLAHDTNVKSGKSWLHPLLGGTATLASYGIAAEDGDFAPAAEAAARTVPEAHLNFLESLPLWFEAPGLLCVHAGIRPGRALTAQDTEDLLWIREPFLSDVRSHGRLVVHGHTALDAPTHFGNRVDLDGGAGYGRPLVPAVFEGPHAAILTETGRRPLTPA